MAPVPAKKVLESAPICTHPNRLLRRKWTRPHRKRRVMPDGDIYGVKIIEMQGYLGGEGRERRWG
jgi:hypothetical protein